jgi:hypothetical protein
MGTQRVQMKGVLPWLVCWACRAGTKDFYPTLAALVSPAQNLFLFFCPHRPATWAGSRAGPPVSECVSPLPSLIVLCLSIAYPGEGGIPRQLVDTVIVVNVEIAGEQGPG